MHVCDSWNSQSEGGGKSVSTWSTIDAGGARFPDCCFAPFRFPFVSVEERAWNGAQFVSLLS